MSLPGAIALSVGDMRFDLHVHTRWSPDSVTGLTQIIRHVAHKGLDGLAITDHNTIAGALALREAAPFPVIVGEEIATSEGEIIGLFLHRTVPRGLSPEETIAAIREQQGVVYIPHPLDRLRREAMGRRVLERIIDRVDALEVFNARNLIPQDNALARQIAAAHGLAMGAGSDAHLPYEIGRAFVEIEPFDSPASFLAALHRGRIEGVVTTPLIHVLTSVTKALLRVSGRLLE